MNLEREALAGVLRKKGLWLFSLFGNAVLLALIYGWFWIPDQRGWQVAFSAAAALGLVALTVWLHASALSHLGSEGVRPWRFLAWMAVLALFLWLVLRLDGYAGRFSVWLASLVTMTIRKPVSPRGTAWVFSVLWTLLVVVGAALLVPFAARGFKDAWRVCRRAAWWLDAVVLLVAGFYLPWRLVHWAPEFGGLVAQTVSLVIRFLLAWVVVVTAWLLLHALAAQHAREQP